MKLFICVDDTDDLTKSTSTGKISDLIAQKIVDMGGTLIKGITRHQLLLHDDIEYTSHNSSMCMELDIQNIDIEKIKEESEKILLENAAESADPGLCFCNADELKDPDKLMSYGKRGQNEIITKEEAYETAAEIGGTFIKEYGGTGIGVIGALAGVGLRLTGCDGTFRGGKGVELEGQSFTVKEWKNMMGIEQVLDFFGKELDDDTDVTVKDQIKLAYLDHKKTLIAKQKDGIFFACKKKDLYEGDKKTSEWNTSCHDFQADNDIEEQYDEDAKACYNCLYRRWTADGFECVKQEKAR